MEAWFWELPQHVLAGKTLQLGECGELARDALGYEGALEALCVEPAQDMLGRGGAREVWSVELAQRVLAEYPL